MKVLCIKDYKHGVLPKGTGKGSKEYATEFKAGQTYDLDEKLAVRLVRDLGYRKNRPEEEIHFEAVDPDEYRHAERRVKEGPLDKFFTPPENPENVKVDV